MRKMILMLILASFTSLKAADFKPVFENVETYTDQSNRKSDAVSPWPVAYGAESAADDLHTSSDPAQPGDPELPINGHLELLWLAAFCVGVYALRRKKMRVQ